MNYISRMGLEFNPFIKNSKEIFIKNEEVSEVSFRLNVILETRGFGVITGSSGKGKTTLIRNWAGDLNSSQYKIIYISLSTLTVSDFYKHLATELGLEPLGRKSGNFRMIQAAITRLSVEKRITPIIILDEANYINSSILNDLKILFNFEMDSKDRAIVLMVGLPKLNNTLNLAAHEPLRQRITMNYHLDGLNKIETKDYIKQKLQAAGCHAEIFGEGALDAIANTAGGIPRMINKICDKCLLVCHVSESTIITTETVMKAINESEIG